MVDERPLTSRRRVLAALTAGASALAGCAGTDTGDETTTDDTTTLTTTTSTTTEATTEPTTTARELPVTGERFDPLTPLDDAVREFVADHDVTAASLAVATNDGVALERGYGWADEDETTATPPDALFRTASLTKSLTSAAVRLLFDDDFDRETRVLSVLDLDPAGDGLGDERLREVTVGHLLDHAGGWDDRITFDPMFRPFRIADALGLDGPPTTRDIARYMLAQPLQFAPGEKHVYSNFGYALLGLVVKAQSGTPFPAFVRQALFDGDPPDPVVEGRTAPAERHEREVHYVSDRECPNVLELDESERVPCADGGAVLAAAGGAGELVTSARTLATFAVDHRLDGFPSPKNPEHATAFGSIFGAFSMLQRRPSGARVAVLLNHRDGPSGYTGLQNVVNEAMAEVDWPAGE
jgi:CubicO group peptidase (beta-lactamase class C family)